MSKTVRVNIGGKDLTLRGENEGRIFASVQVVNMHIQQLQQSLREQSTPTLSLLAALNIAEQYNEVRLQNERDIEFINGELEKMTQYLERAIQQPVT